jgi:hypothetical protein
MTPSFSRTERTLTSLAVDMLSMAMDPGFILTCFLGCKWLVVVVVYLVVLCQHPTTIFIHCCCGLNEHLKAGENVFDLHNCTSGIKEEVEQVYVYRTEKAARITMVKNIINCPCLVLDGIFVPSSYVN